MGLLDDIRTQSVVRTRLCVIAGVLDDLPIDDAKELQVALDDHAMTHTAIARVLAGRGYPINQSGKQVAAHRKETCPCRG
jgi:hypothetical protein